MFERRSDPLLSRRRFFHRLLRSVVAALALIGISLSVGLLGYHFIAGLAWIDAFLESAMIMSGMGPVAPSGSTAAKLFAGCYAIYCGVALLTTAGLVIGPLLHRFFHRLHLADEPKK
jgi:hypothetical protein